MIYLDTSALVKRFVAERGSPRVRALITGEGPVATATIAYAELHAALKRKQREGDLSARDYDLACRQFEREWRACIVVELVDDVLRLTRDLVRRHPLRGFDAIHLASAVMLRREMAEAISFAAADARLLRAAAAERLRAIDVEAA